MSNRGFPSMTALLGLLAVAGYQNRDKLAEMLGGGQQRAAPGGQASSSDKKGDLLGNLATSLGAGGIGGLLTGGLRDLVDTFKQKGHGEVADSWVNHGPNKAIAPPQLEQVIGSDVLGQLAQQTGLSREELLSRLSKTLPDAVDKYTPEGRLPTA